MLTWLIQFGIALISLVLARIALRLAWQRVGTNPSCSRCGYDLRGLPRDAWHCAECGDDLRRRRAVRYGMKVWRWKRASLGICLLAVTAICLWNGVQGARRQDWQPYKPFWWLQHDLESSDVRYRVAAEEELKRRLNKLTNAQLIALVDTRYPVKAGPPGINNLSVIAATKLRRANKLDDGRWIVLCRNLVSVSVATRPSVRHGDPIAFRTEAALRAKVPELRMSVMVDVDDATVDNLPLTPDMDGLHTFGLTDIRDCCGELSAEQWNSVSPGTHRITSEAFVQLRFGTYGDTLLYEMSIPATSTFTVVPSTPVAVTQSPPVNPTPAALKKALAPHSIGWGWIKVRLGDSKSRLPTDVSFNVFVRQGIIEHRVGSFYATNGTASPYTFTTPPISIADQGFDIVLRPSFRDAARSMKVITFWPETIVFENVTRVDPFYPMPQ